MCVSLPVSCVCFSLSVFVSLSVCECVITLLVYVSLPPCVCVCVCVCVSSCQECVSLPGGGSGTKWRKYHFLLESVELLEQKVTIGYKLLGGSGFR